MEIIQNLKWAIEALVFLGLGIHFFGWYALLHFRFRRSLKLNSKSKLPRVTIVKPAHSNNDREEINFPSFLNQDYPGEIEVLFMVSMETDPVVPLIKKILKQHPKKNARLVISKTRNAYWRKMDALFDAHTVLKGEVVIWSDSDAVVRSNYVSQMVAALEEKGVSVVTTPQYDVGANTFGSALKTLGNNCDVGIYAMIYDLMTREKRAGFGHSIGFWLKDFKTFENEAWESLNNSFADDIGLPTLFTNHGKKVVYRHIYCPVQYTDKKLAQMLRQQEKFAICQKTFVGSFFYAIGLLFWPQIWATLLLFVDSFSPTSQSLFFGVFATRVLTSLLFEGLIMGGIKMTIKYFWTIPLWDLMRVYFVIYSFTQNFMFSDGEIYQLGKDLKLKKVTGNPQIKIRKIVSNSRQAEVHSHN
jgi:ceramide glucosyltransferase